MLTKLSELKTPRLLAISWLCVSLRVPAKTSTCSAVRMAANSGAASCTIATLSAWFFAGHFSDSLPCANSMAVTRNSVAGISDIGCNTNGTAKAAVRNHSKGMAGSGMARHGTACFAMAQAAGTTSSLASAPDNMPGCRAGGCLLLLAGVGGRLQLCPQRQQQCRQQRQVLLIRRQRLLRKEVVFSLGGPVRLPNMICLAAWRGSKGAVVSYAVQSGALRPVASCSCNTVLPQIRQQLQ